jgi:hypothetical protein
MFESSLCATSLRELLAWPKRGMEKGWTILRLIQGASRSIPANSEALSTTANKTQERSNSSSALCYRRKLNGAGVNRMPMRRGIVSEANARGKTMGYADGDTATRKVEVRVEVKCHEHACRCSDVWMGYDPLETCPEERV